VTSANPAIVTIGNFDGVHLGHQKLIGQVADRARALGLRSMAVTFEPHPEQVLFPERKLTHLSTSEERRVLLHANGMDNVWVCPFTTELARLAPGHRAPADR
jgi:riboflavin kinase / FMN adenylyltransferase